MNWFFILTLALLGLSSCTVKHKRGADVDAVIEHYKNNKAQAEACFLKGLSEDKSIQGRVTLVWKVDQSGRAKNAQIQSSELLNPTVESCLLDHLNGLSFPPQPKFSPATVEYELNFTTGR